MAKVDAPAGPPDDQTRTAAADKAVATRGLWAAHLPVCPDGTCRLATTTGQVTEPAGRAILNRLIADRRDALVLGGRPRVG